MNIAPINMPRQLPRSGEMDENVCKEMLVTKDNFTRLLTLEKSISPADVTIHFNGCAIKTNNFASLYTEIKDIFIAEIYGFKSQRPSPVVIDGGSHVGLFALYVKQRYPGARIKAFEPDESSFECLIHNVTINRLDDVECFKKGLYHSTGKLNFSADNSDGGSLLGAQGSFKIETCRLSDYLSEEIDYLKLNIEGVEWDVIREIESRLRHVKELCVEYHGFPEIGQKLHLILSVLDRQGFRYLIYDFDRETNPTTKPPFILEKDTRFFLLIYAKRL